MVRNGSEADVQRLAHSRPLSGGKQTSEVRFFGPVETPHSKSLASIIARAAGGSGTEEPARSGALRGGGSLSLRQAAL